MKRFVRCLQGSPGLAGILVLFYAVTTIAIHEKVNGLVRGTQQVLGPRLFFALAWTLLAAAGLLLGRALGNSRGTHRVLVTIWAALVALAAAVAYHYLFTVVSEAVHFLQYALLTWLIYPLARRIGESMLWANLVGMVDEGYQYWVLHADWGIYLDWNDIVVNVVGTLIGGLCLALAFGDSKTESSSRQERRLPLAFVVTTALLVAGWLLVSSGKIALHAGPGGRRPADAWLLLDRGAAGAQPFWMMADWAQKRFHVISAATGSFVVALFAALAMFVDLHWSRKAR